MVLISNTSLSACQHRPVSSDDSHPTGPVQLPWSPRRAGEAARQPDRRLLPEHPSASQVSGASAARQLWSCYTHPRLRTSGNTITVS